MVERKPRLLLTSSQGHVVPSNAVAYAAKCNTNFASSFIEMMKSAEMKSESKSKEVCSRFASFASANVCVPIWPGPANFELLNCI